MRLFTKFPVRKPVGMGPVNELALSSNERVSPVVVEKPALKSEGGRVPDKLLLDKSNVKLPSGSADLNNEVGRPPCKKLFAKLICSLVIDPERMNCSGMVPVSLLPLKLIETIRSEVADSKGAINSEGMEPVMSLLSKLTTRKSVEVAPESNVEGMVP